MRTVLVSVAAIVFAAAAGVASPQASQTTLPGSPVVIEGEIVMSVEDDFRTGRATRRYFLNQSGRQYDLRLTSREAAGLQPGMTVRITGRLVGHILIPDSSDGSVVVLPGPTR
jgi:hypothetical protein